ncbi:MAG TPA: DsrE family protein [Dissulfurispiraceae bacterium]|nr:DsrE family protein [Dissulfurispiraceae bacterium]
MGSICIILRRPPYGSVDAAEAIRHALGGVTEEMETQLVLVDGGVAAARRGQNTGSSGYASIEDGIKDCIDMGVDVSVDIESLKSAGMEPGDLVDGAKTADKPGIAAIVKDAATVMIF